MSILNGEATLAKNHTPTLIVMWMEECKKPLLVLKEVSLESRDNYGRARLSGAVESGSEGAVKLLL